MEGIIVIIFLGAWLVYEIRDEKLKGWKAVRKHLTKKKM